jgi:protein TonB
MRRIFFIIVFFSIKTAYAQDTLVPKGLDTTSIIFGSVDVDARYPGGSNAWRSYLESSSILSKASSKAARKKVPVGTYTVVVQFVIDRNGDISEVKSLTNHGYGMEEAAEDVIRASGKWLPASKDGKTVKAYRKQPITYVFVK